MYSTDHLYIFSIMLTRKHMQHSCFYVDIVSKEAVRTTSAGSDKDKSDQDSDLEITRIEPTSTSNKNSSLNQFIFNIADGGFTELHTLWQVLKLKFMVCNFVLVLYL